MVAFFGADHGFAPRIDSVSYVPSITKVISDTTNTGSEEMTPKEETTTPKETTSTKDQEKVPEEAAGVKRQMNDSPPLSSLKRSKSMAQ